MSLFKVHTVDTCPPDSKAPLLQLQKSVGMIPNLAGAMAESPVLLKSFLAVRELLYGGSFTPQEVQVLALTNAFENSCRYCMSLHSVFALKVGVGEESVQALRRGQVPKEPRHAALSRFSRMLVAHRGEVSSTDVQQLLAAGYSTAQALEVVAGVAASILPNFAHHLTECPVDEAFRSQAWLPER